MVVRLQQAGAAWEGADGGITFHLRPADADAPVAAELLEGSRYSLAVSGSPADPTVGLRVHGLPHKHTLRQGLLLADLHLGHEFGDLQLQVVRGPQILAEAVVGVGARYLDVANDYVAIHADLERIAHGLAYDVWRQAAQAAYPDFTVPPGTAEWLALLSFLWERIKSGLAAIERDPDQELRDIYEIVPASRARGLDQRGMRWLAQHPEAWELFPTAPPVAAVPLAGGHAVPVRALSRRREVTLDTSANRLLKARLRRIERRLARVAAEVHQLPKAHFAAGRKGAYRDRLLTMLRQSQRTTLHGFLRDVSDVPVPASRSTHVARADARYREVLRAASLLEWGVLQGVGGEPLLMSERETWQIYEYWVYLYLVSTFDTSVWRCRAQTAVRLADDASVVVDLARGRDSEVQFETIAPGPKTVVTLTFHKIFRSRDSVRLGPGARSVQRDVDIILEVQAPGLILRAALDPKYQVAEERDGCKAAPLGALDDMHVYRDAVGRWAMGLAGSRVFEPTLDVAVAIFPSRDESCAAAHRFCRSLVDGVGALPLLPRTDTSQPRLLDKFVQRLAEGVLEAPTLP